jgi:uncharacterized protein YjbJ (UPF0337 family)
MRTLTQDDLTLERKSMNAGRLKGKWMQFKGELKQRWGKFFDNALQQLEGSYDKILGMLQERYGSNCVSLVREQCGEKKEELIKWADQWQQRSQVEATKERRAKTK